MKRIGEGTETTYPIHGKDAILLPNEFCVGCKPNDDMQILIDRVFGDLQTIHDWNERMTYIVERAILTPLNKDVDIINNYIGKKCVTNEDGTPIQVHTYLSADSAMQQEEENHNTPYPEEFLNSLTISGLPPHRLDLFVGCPIILIKNMTGGLANGTRLIITKLMTRVIEAKNATGPSQNQVVCIPRITMIPSNVENLPYTLRRRQFPV